MRSLIPEEQESAAVALAASAVSPDNELDLAAQLGALLGHTGIRRHATPDGEIVLDDNGEVLSWTRDWSVCGPLIGVHKIDIEQYDKYVATYTVIGCRRRDFVVWYKHHPDLDTALRCAIVKAVCAKLAEDEGMPM